MSLLEQLRNNLSTSIHEFDMDDEALIDAYIIESASKTKEISNKLKQEKDKIVDFLKKVGRGKKLRKEIIGNRSVQDLYYENGYFKVDFPSYTSKYYEENEENELKNDGFKNKIEPLIDTSAEPEVKQGVFGEQKVWEEEFPNFFNAKYVKLDLTIRKVSSQHLGEYSVWDITFGIRILVPEKEVEFIYQCDPDEEQSVDFAISLLQPALDKLWHVGSMPPIYDLNYNVTDKPHPNAGVVKLPDSSMIWIPKNSESYDKRKEFFQRTKKNGHFPPTATIMLDPHDEVLVRTNSSGEIAYLDLSNSVSLSNEDAKQVLEQTVDESITRFNSPVSVFNVWDMTPNLSTETKKFFFQNENQRLCDLYRSKPKETVSALNELDEAINDKYSNTNVSVERYLHIKGRVLSIKNNIENYDNIDKDVKDRREKFNNATKNDITELPSIRDNMILFPHQAEALAKLREAGETAILDINTGGGKTPILIFDILQLMQQGEVKRPLVVVPNHLVPQWLGEIMSFTGGQVNPFALTTSTVNNWNTGNEDNISKMVKDAPLNTIFVTTYDFLKTNKSTNEYGGTRYPKVDWIKSLLGVDYVAMDESQKIKNEGTDAHKVGLKFADLPKRRISTGTLIPNTPEDLVGQMSFLNPRLLGNRDEFLDKFAIGRKNNKATGWKKNWKDDLQKKLNEGTFFLKYDKSEWAALLPDIQYNEYFVDLTPQQAKVYSDLVEHTINEILEDPELRKAWDEFINSGGEEVYMPSKLLGKIARLEQFLTGPNRSEFIDYALPEKDKMSPKIKQIDDLIDYSIKSGYKCLVGVHYRWSASHLLENSRHADKALYYDASQKENLYKFQSDDNVQVLFAVVSSITEGLNLQVADRLIVADIDWMPGNLEQLLSRIFRPDPVEDPKTGEWKNKNEGKTVKIDTVIANHSADTFKYCYQIYKKAVIAQSIEGFDIDIPIPPQLDRNGLALKQRMEDMGGEKYLELNDKYQNWMKSKIDNKRNQGKIVPIRPNKGEPIPGRQIKVPWVVGMPLPEVEGGTPLTEWLDDRGARISDIVDKNIKDELKGKIVKTEWGEGKIVKVNEPKGNKEKPNTLNIRYPDGETKNVHLSKIIILDKTELDQEEYLDKTEPDRNLPNNEIHLSLGLYYGIPTLIASLKDPDSSKLKELGFVYQGPYYVRYITTPNIGYKVYNSIKENFKIGALKKELEEDFFEEGSRVVVNTNKDEDNPEYFLGTIKRIKGDLADIVFDDKDEMRLDLEKSEDYIFLSDHEKKVPKEIPANKVLRYIDQEFLKEREMTKPKAEEYIEYVLDNIRKSRFVARYPKNYKNFLKIRHRRAKKGRIKIYPLITDDFVVLVADKRNNPKAKGLLKKLKFDEEEGAWYYFAKNRKALSKMISNIEDEGLTIANKDELRETAQKYKVRI